MSNRLGLPDDWIEIDKRISAIEAQLSVRALSNPFVSPITATKKVFTAPPAVSGLGLSAASAPGVIQISWAAVPIQNLRYYEIQFSQFQTFIEPQIFTSLATSFTFTGGATGVTYYIRVRAVNSLGQQGDWSPILNSTTGQTISLGGTGITFPVVTIGRSNWGQQSPIENYDSFDPGNPGANDFLITEFDGLGRELLPFSVFTFSISFYFSDISSSDQAAAEASVNQLRFSIYRKEDPADTSKWFQVGSDVVSDYKISTNAHVTPFAQSAASGLLLPFTPPAGTWPYYLRIRAISSTLTYGSSPAITDNLAVQVTPLTFDLRFIRV